MSWTRFAPPIHVSPRPRGRSTAGARPIPPWRLYLSSQAIARVCQHHCGELSVNKRLPDFLFRLPSAYLQHAFDELMRTGRLAQAVEGADRDGFGGVPRQLLRLQDDLPMLAGAGRHAGDVAGATITACFAWSAKGNTPRTAFRFVSGEGKRGGRHTTFEARLHERQVTDEWMYDIECAGLHNFVCGVGNVVAHNTNEPEYRKLQSNEFMEALRDRTVKIDHPYVSRLKDEIKIYEKDFNVERVKGKHIAPHTIEDRGHVGGADATGAAQARQPDAAAKAQALQRQDAAGLPPRTTSSELKREAVAEGMHGISPRYIQDKISNAIVAHSDEDSVNPFMVLHELESGLRHHSLITSQEQLQHYPRVAGGGQGGVRGHREERGAAGHRRGRGRPDAVCGNYNRQRESLHAAREGPQPLQPATTRSRTSG